MLEEERDRFAHFLRVEGDIEHLVELRGKMHRPRLCTLQGRGTPSCGAPQERALTAVQFEQDEKAMALRALALQEQARRIQSGEIVCVANYDVETKSCLPFLIGKVCQSPFLAFELEDSFMKSER
jgi:hypothetical protein